MRLIWTHLTNYRCHANLKIKFNPGFNAIVGVNGGGKTSLLKAVCDSLTGYSSYLFGLEDYQALQEINVARLQAEAIHGRYRFESQYPVEIHTTAEIFGNKHVWAVRRASHISNTEITGQPPGRLLRSKPQVWEQRDRPSLPVIAFYRANRHWNQPQPDEMQAALARNARVDGYVQWWDASLDSSALQTWVISKCLERFQTSSESGMPFDDIQSDELALVNQALATAVEGIKSLKFDLRQKSLLVEWAGSPEAEREPTAFENLSDGQRAVIGLVADIARRMCVLNPQLGQAVTSETPGVVLVDELDMHLHPRWQRILTSGLKRAFPKVQFIVASHSPQVLGELKPEEIILLRPNGTAHPQVSYGLTSSQVLEEIMDANARTPEVERLLSEVFESLERKDLPLARQKIAELETTAPGIPELAGAQALLRRKEVLGR